VSARGGTYLQHNIEDVVFVNLKFRSGVSAQIQVSWLDPRKERRLTIRGLAEDGRVRRRPPGGEATHL